MYQSFNQSSIPTAPAIVNQEHRISSLLEKGSSCINEDVVLRDAPLFGVFDGATSLGESSLVDGASGGLMAARLAAKAFMHSDGNLYDRAGYANRLIREEQQRLGLDPYNRLQLWSTGMAVVQLYDNSLEFCQTGDVDLILVYHDGHCKRLSPDNNVDAGTLEQWKSLPKKRNGSIYKELAEQIREVRLQMNRTYGVLNGEPEALSFLVHGYASLEGVSDILLFTDGFHLPKEDPAESFDAKKWVDTYLRGGLQGVRDQVRRFERLDPELKRYPRFKQHDDMAAIAIRLSNYPI